MNQKEHHKKLSFEEEYRKLLIENKTPSMLISHFMYSNII
jgi:hypothetical protein